MILSADPLARGIGSRERQERLIAGYQHALQRLQACLARPSKQMETSDLQALDAVAAAMETSLQGPAMRHDPDFFRSALDLIYRMERATGVHCGEAVGMDEALLLIANKHDGKQ